MVTQGFVHFPWPGRKDGAWVQEYHMMVARQFDDRIGGWSDELYSIYLKKR
jgi:hypothetical protein